MIYKGLSHFLARPNSVGCLTTLESTNEAPYGLELWGCIQVKLGIANGGLLAIWL